MNPKTIRTTPRKAARALLGVLLLSTIGCNTFDDTPDWVKNPKSVYSDSEFLVAVGEGDTREAAENSGAAKISRIFEAHIESDERLTDEVYETTTTFERTTGFTADINILSSQTLYNVQHAEAWKDDEGRYHAVAYLNRRNTAAIYRAKIDDQTSRVNFHIATAAEEKDPVKRYATLRAASRHALEAEYLLKQLKVIHPQSVPDMTPSYTMNRLRKSLADTAKQIRVQISVEGDADQRMYNVLEQFITDYGFVVGTPVVLQFDGRVGVKDTGERERNLVFVRYELDVNIKDASGSVLASVGSKGREAHKTIEQAEIRSYRTMEDVIIAGGADRLDTYFDSLIDQMPQ